MSFIVIKSKSVDYGGKLMQNFQSLQQDGQLCDVVLVAALDGQKFPCHRLVLAACSEFFRAMFTRDWRESQQHEVPLGEVSGDQLQPLLDFCYRGEMEVEDVSSVADLLCAARLLLFDDARAACANFLRDRISPKHCLPILALAEQYKLNALKSIVESYLGKQFIKLCLNPDFIDQLSFTRLRHLIARDDLLAPSEWLVFESVMLWVRHDARERNQHIPKLMELVRLPFIAARYLTEQVQPICKEHGCLQLLGREPDAKQKRKRRSGRSDLLTVFTNMEGCRTNDLRFHVELYDPTMDAWKTIGHIDPARFDYAAAILNGKLITVGGGRDARIDLCTMTSFDLRTKTTTQLASMPTSRRLMGVAVLDGQLYAVGGLLKPENTDICTLERYDPAANVWSPLPPMTVGRSSLGVAVLDGRLYAVGGRNFRAISDANECYDPHTNQWTTRANITQARTKFGLDSGHGFLYAVGGMAKGISFLNSVERYDPSSDTWTQLCSINIGKGPLNCIFRGDCLLAYSDLNGLVGEYNEITDTWSRWPSLTSRLHHLKMLYIPNTD